jgi:uncharacterized protein YjbI with pentapeptide repeats
LPGAFLSDTDLYGAKLDRADLSDADLSTASGLTQAQLDHACGNPATRLPPWLTVRSCD